MSSTLKRLAAVAVGALGTLAMSTPSAFSSTPATTATSGPPGIAVPAVLFVPPRVGPLSVDIGPTIIGGQVMDPGLQVSTPGSTIPAFSRPPAKTDDPRGTRVRMNGGG